MQLVSVRHLWGITEAWETLFPRIAAEGFTAIELPVQWLSEDDVTRLQHLAEKHQFEIIPQCFTEGNTVAEHLQSFRFCLETLISIKINSSTSLSLNILMALIGSPI